jgi:hypothetical protein
MRPRCAGPGLLVGQDHLGRDRRGARVHVCNSSESAFDGKGNDEVDEEIRHGEGPVGERCSGLGSAAEERIAHTFGGYLVEGTSVQCRGKRDRYTQDSCAPGRVESSRFSA